MTMAREAPLKGEKLLTASPFGPVKKPLLLAMSEPSAAKVFRVKTDFVAFLTHEGWASAEERSHRLHRFRRSRTPVIAILAFIVLLIFILI